MEFRRVLFRSERLLPLAAVVTPNLLEAQLLTGIQITDEAGMLKAAEVIFSTGPVGIPATARNLPGTPVDLLPAGRQAIRSRGQRIDSRHTNGTGCTLASAIAS